MIALLLGAALAQDYRFPASDEDYANFYPTAYKDHDGYDWACGDHTYSGHRGSDYGFGSFTGMYEGQTIVAAAAGVVTATNDGEYDECTTGDCEGGGGYGNYVWVQHADGKATLYGHLAQWSVAVSVGQAVDCGTPLGLGGSSGYSTGPHLHFGVYGTDGDYHDPFYGDCVGPPSYWVDQGDYLDLPAATCEAIAPCEASGELACGETRSADSGSGGAVRAYYGCADWLYSGPEQAWSFATDRAETVTLSLTGLSGDLDIYVMESDACDARDCLAYADGSATSDEVVTFTAEAGHVYTVVVDGYEGTSSAYTLSADCAGSWPSEAEDSAVETGDAETGGAESGGAESGDSDPEPALDSAAEGAGPPGKRSDGPSGCGCASGAGDAGRAGWAAISAALLSVILCRPRTRLMAISARVALLRSGKGP